MSEQSLRLLTEHKCFGGIQQRWSHHSSLLNCTMHFSVYLPPPAAIPPALVWCLSGLTCNDENFTNKAGAQRIAAELGLALMMPDTSPRGAAVADDESYALGQGAGFYLNATQAPWATHYQMYDYLIEELPALLTQQFKFAAKQAILGHSMGGHGALVLGLRESERFSSISALAPIVNPSQVPWGVNAFQHYLGEDRHQWSRYDACQLLGRATRQLPILIDQGRDDQFLQQQLQPDVFQQAAQQKGFDCQLRWHNGYDHSYFFIATVIEDHLRFHAKHLNAC